MSQWVEASQTGSGLYLMELPGQSPPHSTQKALHEQIPVLTTFSVTLVIGRQELGVAKTLIGPSRDQTQS